ncbi:MAG: helix-turn-helix domain-containing protein [Gemmatimonadales bacterium]|nr:helix-turn-helix domain-containing protein [Gemmatimonadales bacterium]
MSETMATSMAAGAELPRLLSARQVAAETGLSAYRIYELARLGKLPHRKLGRSVVFTREALADFLRGSDVGAAAAQPNGVAKRTAHASKPRRPHRR